MAAVEDAVIVAGGIGSRMLPASAAIAKELLPLVDIPAMTHLAREAINAGAKRLHIITSPTKDFSSILSDNSRAAQKRSDIDKELISPFNDVEIKVHVQEVPKGFGVLFRLKINNPSKMSKRTTRILLPLTKGAFCDQGVY